MLQIRPLGGLDPWIYNPTSVAMYLAASPVMAYETLPGRLPMYLIYNATVAAQTLPMPDLTANVPSVDQFYVPTSYMKDVLFAQTAQALVQGISQRWIQTTVQPISLIAMFATSQPVLSAVVLGICATCALIATISGMMSLRYCHAPLDVVRLLAISRNNQLDDAFASYADIDVPVDDELLERKIGYNWVEEIGSRALMMDA